MVKFNVKSECSNYVPIRSGLPGKWQLFNPKAADIDQRVAKEKPAPTPVVEPEPLKVEPVVVAPVLQPVKAAEVKPIEQIVPNPVQTVQLDIQVAPITVATTETPEMKQSLTSPGLIISSNLQYLYNKPTEDQPKGWRKIMSVPFWIAACLGFVFIFLMITSIGFGWLFCRNRKQIAEKEKAFVDDLVRAQDSGVVLSDSLVKYLADRKGRVSQVTPDDPKKKGMTTKGEDKVTRYAASCEKEKDGLTRYAENSEKKTIEDVVQPSCARFVTGPIARASPSMVPMKFNDEEEPQDQTSKELAQIDDILQNMNDDEMSVHVATEENGCPAIPTSVTPE